MTSATAEGGTAWTLAEAWGGRSHVAELGGPVHWVDFGGPDTGVPIVLVHGLGGSHLNWVRLAPILARRSRVIALDLAGFGLTPGSGRRTTVTANAELLDRFLWDAAGGRAVLVGNSMGGMVSMLQADAQPESVAGLVLIDPSVPVPRELPDLQVASQFLLYAVPVLGEKYLAFGNRRMTDRQRVQRVIDLCFADPSRAPEQVLEAATALARHRRSVAGQEADFLQAARSLIRLLARPQRYATLMHGVRCPVLLVHGELDRLVPIAAARKAAADNPAWETLFLPGVGHTPQLEAPDEVGSSILDWLERHQVLGPPTDPA